MTIPPSLAWGAYLLLAVLLASLAADRMAPRTTFPARAASLLERRGAPLWAGGLCALYCGWLWGSLDAVPVAHDEAAYLLQAQTFARGAWTLPSPPLPEFFEQFHVFVEPVLATKYPPGHALALVPGVWLGLPGLLPVMLNGLAGGLLFAIARRISTPATALLAVFLWLASPSTAAYRATYFSQVTTSALLLLAWWALLRWSRTRHAGWLVTVVLAVAWCAITRPLTALAFALPIGAILAVEAWRSGRVRQLVLAGAAGVPIVALTFVYTAEVGGEPGATLYPLYTSTYMPFDRLGFTASHAEPSRPLPPDMRAFNRVITREAETYTFERLPQNLARRVSQLLRRSWGRAWLGMAPLFLVGLLVMNRQAAVGALSAVLVFFAYAFYFFGHASGWYLYFLEAQIVVIFLTAAGTVRVARFAMRGREGSDAAREVLLVGLLIALSVPLVGPQVLYGRAMAELWRAPTARFRELLERAPEPVLVFVRYGRTHNVNRSLVTNVPDLSQAKAVVARDRGGDNHRLQRHFPDRKPFLYDEASGRLVPMDPASGAGLEPPTRCLEGSSSSDGWCP